MVKLSKVRGVSYWVSGRPVSINSAYGAGQRGRKFLRPEALVWKTVVRLAFSGVYRPKFNAEQLPLRVRCTFYGVRGDADNYLKLTLDGLKLALGIDDKWFSPVESVVVRKRHEGEQGACIEVWEAAQPQGRAAA